MSLPNSGWNLGISSVSAGSNTILSETSTQYPGFLFTSRAAIGLPSDSWDLWRNQIKLQAKLTCDSGFCYSKTGICSDIAQYLPDLEFKIDSKTYEVVASNYLEDYIGTDYNATCLVLVVKNNASDPIVE